MPTPDWEEWLRRQDIPVEDTTTVEKYRKYLEDELGIHGGSLDVASGIYAEKYDVFPTLGITPFDWRGTTRYGIKGLMGAWGRESALRLGQDIAETMGLYDTAAILAGWFAEEFP